jgi:parallel beta-helix repeat protein
VNPASESPDSERSGPERCREREQSPAPLARREFLGGLLALTATTLLCATGAASAAATGAAARKRGSARIDVREHGARGDGVRDDTASFQDAVDALPKEGGTVYVPAGAYLIDPLRSVKLRSRMHLSMDQGARLVTKPNAAPRAYVLLAQELEEVEISGGRIIGDRNSHLGTTGEWGHGIRVRGCSAVTIRDIRISDCWGDAISAGGIMPKGQPSRPGRDLLVANVVCTGNRRQGLTIGSYRGVRVRDSEFSGTGGTPPAAGIDIEPDTDVARDVVIENCLVRDNRGPGIQLYKRAAEVTIRKCTIERNRGDGVLALAAVDCVFAENIIRNNKLAGISIRGASRNVRISGNRLSANLQGGKQQVRTAADSTAIQIEASNRFE